MNHLGELRRYKRIKISTENTANVAFRRKIIYKRQIYEIFFGKNANKSKILSKFAALNFHSNKMLYE